MAGKLGLLLDKIKRQDGEARKCVVVVGIVIGVLIAGGLFFGCYVFADIDGYLHETKQIYRVYDFYDLKVGTNETAVYFVGSSIIGDAVHCCEIDDILKNAGYNISTYNLLVDSDMPVRRISQIENIIESSPSLIIYGVTYKSTLDTGWVDETVVLVHNRLNINKSSLYLYSDKELDDLNQIPDLFYKKKFIKNANSPYTTMWGIDGLSYSKDPFSINQDDRRKDNISYSEIQKQANNTLDTWRPLVTSESTRQKEALVYTVKRFKESNIPVIIINTPLHPLFSEKITNESRRNYFEWLNSTGAKYYDFETKYNETYFRDSHHATFESGKWFSKEMADLIIEQVENDVIHYT